MAVGRLLRTVRHLKPVQVWGRAAHLANWTRPDLRPAPGLRAPAGAWIRPAAKPAARQGPTIVRFLNETGDIAGPGAWQAGHELLWLYNLHYFDDLLSAEAAKDPVWRAALVERWIAENPPCQGVGWAPYPTSLRMVNWIKAQLGGFPLPAGAVASLAVQARWLGAHLEHHLLGNHLLANAKALVFAGTWFDGDEAADWRRKGLRLLERQLPEQILADGGHFERSPMYQAIILEDLLDLLNLGRAYGSDDAVTRTLAGWIAAMRAWLAAMTHPDGRIGFFNDAAFGIAAEPAELDAYAGRLGLAPTAAPAGSVTELRESGYVRLQLGDAVVLIDAAPVGPDYLPGHAHADTLSCEFSLGGTRVLVNGGTSVYGSGPQRRLERGTAAHTTVEIDGRDSSEVWAGFRVGRRARVRDLEVRQSANEVSVSAAHDGYRWRPGGPVHRRAWTLTPSSLTIRDDVEGEAAQAVAHFHLGPDVEARVSADGESGTFALPGRRSLRWRTSLPATVEPDEWRPEFGVRRPTRQLVARLTGPTLQTRFDW